MIITKIGVNKRKTITAVNIEAFLKLIFITVFDKDESIVVLFYNFTILIYYILNKKSRFFHFLLISWDRLHTWICILINYLTTWKKILK